jgi:hypothetical protein
MSWFIYCSAECQRLQNTAVNAIKVNAIQVNVFLVSVTLIIIILVSDFWGGKHLLTRLQNQR